MYSRFNKGAFLAFCIVQLTFCICSAQVTFYKEYIVGKEAEGHAVLQEGSNYIMAGVTYTSQLDSNYVFMLKTDSIGDTLWTRTYAFKQTFYISSPNALHAAAGGGYILTGFARDATQTDSIFALRTDANGTMMWFRFLSAGTVEIAANSIQPTLNGGSIIGGHYFPTLTAQNIFLSKIDASGNLVWSKGIVVDNDAQATCVRTTADSGFIITGEAARRVYLVKTNKNGVAMWSKAYFGSAAYDIANSVKETTDGGFIVSGTLTNDTTGVSRMFLMKTNSDGDLQWVHSYAGTSEFPVTANGADALQTSDGGYAIAGYTVQNGSPANYICLIRADSSGNLLWSRTYGTNDSSNASAFALKQTVDDGFILAGKSNHAFLIKTDDMGRAHCSDTTITIIEGTPDFVTFFALLSDSTLTANAAVFPLKLSRGAIVNTVCNPIGIEEAEISEGDLVIYPNPGNGEFSISIQKDLEVGNWKLDVCDLAGRVLINRFKLQASPKISGKANFKLQLPAGIYIVRLISDNQTAAKKLIVQ
jgi:hypothetical protein